MDSQLDIWYNHVITLVEQSADIVREGFAAIEKGSKCVEDKSEDGWDMVTQYDKRVEAHIIGGLAKAFPDHKFIGEETTADTGLEPVLTNAPTWIIDPIDGTTNFVHSLPMSCVSVALAVQGRVEIGIIACPLLGDMYTVRRGHGAYKNGKRIHTSGVEDIRKSLIAVEISLAYLEEHKIALLARTRALVSIAHGIRSLGSAVYSLCLLAQGALDGYHVEGLHPWDMAAGGLLVCEAGGELLSSDGTDFNFMTGKIVAAGSHALAKTIVEIIKKTYESP